MNLEQFQSLLATSKGAQIVTLVTVTEPDMRKYSIQEETNPYLGKIKKISKINGIVNWSYANAVNNQLVREGKTPDFISQPRKWGTRLNGLPFVSHVTKEGKNKLYLEIKVERSLSHEYRDKETNELIDSKLVEPYLKEKRKNDITNKEIICRDYDVDHIESIRINGETYTIDRS